MLLLFKFGGLINNEIVKLHFFSCRPKPSDVGDAFVLGVCKKEILVRQELLAVNRFLCCGSIFSCTRMARTKLKNSYTVQYEDASGKPQFGEIQRFLVLQNHHVALVTKLAPSGSITSDIKSSSELLNRFRDSGVLVSHMTVTKRSKCLFCIPLCNIKRKCVVVRSSNKCGDDELTISTFPNIVEHDWYHIVWCVCIK